MDRKQDQVWGIGSSQPSVTWDWEPITDYWKRLGYEPQRKPNCLEIETDTGHVIRDHGSRVEISGGPPTDQQIAQMVAAAKQRGCRDIRFFGS